MGICVPGLYLDDGNPIRLNRTQSWLWRSFKEFCQEVASLNAQRKILYLGGDLGELDTKRRSVQLFTANKAVIEKMINCTLEPLYEIVDSVIVIRGTPAHEGKGCWIEESFANNLDHTIRDLREIHDTENGKKPGRGSWYHLRSVIGGVKLDLAHHASMTRSPWGRGNSANLIAKKITWNYMVSMQQPPPNLALRGHNHVVAESSGFPVKVQYLPAWTTATEYSYRAGYENTPADVGGIVYLLEDGAFNKLEYLFKPTESRQVWAMKI